jgi:ribosomal protein S10
MYLNIAIRSKNYNSLKSFLRIFKTLTKTEELKLNKILKVFQHKRFKKVFTILRSPHVNKSAQEQFEYNLFVKYVNIKSQQILKILIILKKIKTISFSDIEIKLKFIINSISKKDISIYNLKSKKIRIVSKKKKRKSLKLKKKRKTYSAFSRVEQIKLYLLDNLSIMGFIRFLKVPIYDVDSFIIRHFELMIFEINSHALFRLLKSGFPAESRGVGTAMIKIVQFLSFSNSQVNEILDFFCNSSISTEVTSGDSVSPNFKLFTL